MMADNANSKEGAQPGIGNLHDCLDESQQFDLRFSGKPIIDKLFRFVIPSPLQTAHQPRSVLDQFSSCILNNTVPRAPRLGYIERADLYLRQQECKRINIKAKRLAIEQIRFQNRCAGSHHGIKDNVSLLRQRTDELGEGVAVGISLEREWKL